MCLKNDVFTNNGWFFLIPWLWHQLNKESENLSLKKFLKLFCNLWRNTMSTKGLLFFSFFPKLLCVPVLTLVLHTQWTLKTVMWRQKTHKHLPDTRICAQANINLVAAQGWVRCKKHVSRVGMYLICFGSVALRVFFIQSYTLRWNFLWLLIGGVFWVFKKVGISQGFYRIWNISLKRYGNLQTSFQKLEKSG